MGYIRVSTEEQNPERQLQDIIMDRVFIDKASAKDVHRPALVEMMDFVREGDTMIVHSLDRLARNLSDLRKLVTDITAKGIKITFIKENLIFSGDDQPLSILLLSVVGAFAEFERSLLKERQKEGIALAKKRGRYRGRKKILSSEQVSELKKRVHSGEKKTAFAQDFAISRETLYKYLKA